MGNEPSWTIINIVQYRSLSFIYVHSRSLSFSFENRVKRYIYGCFCKIFNENVVDIDKCSVIIRNSGYKNYRKPSSDIFRAVGGQLGKLKHSNVKIHLLGWVGFREKVWPPWCFLKEICVPIFSILWGWALSHSFGRNFFIIIDCSWTIILNILVDRLESFYSQMLSIMLKHQHKVEWP